MKKLFAIILVLVLALTGVAFAEEEKLPPMPEEAAVYEGAWICDRASIEMIWEEEGFRVFISWSSSAEETSEWEYSCYYNAETNSLEAMPTGIHSDNVYGADGEIISSTVIYEDGEATFTLDEEGHLLWHDAKEDAGKDMLFEKVEILENVQ